MTNRLFIQKSHRHSSEWIGSIDTMKIAVAIVQTNGSINSIHRCRLISFKNSLLIDYPQSH